jgi:hypothetical protein
MGWLQDMLKEVPLSAVLQDRIKSAEERFEKASRENDDYKRRIARLERENEALRAQVPTAAQPGLEDDTERVLVYMFRATELENRDVGNMARGLNMERGVLQYHLDRLRGARLADISGANYGHDHTHWALEPAGRRYVVERKLI